MAKAGRPIGSGGKGRDKLAGRGPTPKAEERTGHPAARRAASVARRAAAGQQPPGRAPRDKDAYYAKGGPRARSGGTGDTGEELVTGRNAVSEALKARVPATSLLVQVGIDPDERVTEALALAKKRKLDVLETGKAELDRIAGRSPHQGLALRVPPYAYLHPDDLLARAAEATEIPLLVALDSVTDPGNLGSVIRSTAAFGGQGVLVPERRAAGVTASAWKASAGAAARIPVAQAVNLTRTLTAYKKAGYVVVGLAAGGSVSLDEFEAAVDPLVLVVGSEGKGLSRLVSETCDLLLSIPISSAVESLNAGVAAAVVLSEVARRRRLAGDV